MSQALADQPLPTRCSTMETFDRATLLAQIETADNARTGRRYRGLNVLALWLAAQAEDYADARWATYRQ